MCKQETFYLFFIKISLDCITQSLFMFEQMGKRQDSIQSVLLGVVTNRNKEVRHKVNNDKRSQKFATKFIMTPF